MIKPSSEKCRVLIAADDPQVCAQLTELIANEGYEVVSCEDGGAAFELVKSFEPDVVISDLMMPVLSGIELCLRLKQDVETAHVPVVLMGAHAAEKNHGSS